MSSDQSPVIVWFRRDLRLADNPALTHAAATGRPILPCYILDRTESPAPGGAARWWLGKSLKALGVNLIAAGSPLVLRSGHPEVELPRLAEEIGAGLVVMNRLFEPAAWARDAEIAHELKSGGVDCRGYNGSLLCTPGSVLNGSGQPYRVFTPFSKSLLSTAEPRDLAPAPTALSPVPDVGSEAVDDWNLEPSSPDWSKGFDWMPGEAGAHRNLGEFVQGGLARYSSGRDKPAEHGSSSRLSPHLHWGELHPWRVVESVRAAKAPASESDVFIREIVWREFSAHLLHHFPYLPERSFRPEYDAFEWRDDPDGFKAWTQGRTGYPIVDAGMRQLWKTGWMHNRVRMIVASFLVKDLLIDWRKGQAWFWDTLVDADLANNSQNWQWIAGSGADASPFFRVFNPTTQGEKFDPEGDYVRRWVPELAALPARWIHTPHDAPADVRSAAGVTPMTYPKPIVDHKAARERALEALKQIARAD